MRIIRGKDRMFKLINIHFQVLPVRKGKVALDFIHALTYPHRSNAHKIFFFAIFKVYTVGWVAIEA